MFQCDNQISAAIDFWYRTGYSSADSVFGKKQYPVSMAKAAEYLAYDDDDDDDDDTDDDDENDDAKTDYKRRIKRKKERQRSLKYVHGQIWDILKERERKREEDNNNDANDELKRERIEIENIQLRQVVDNSMRHNVDETMSEIQQRRLYHAR